MSFLRNISWESLKPTTFPLLWKELIELSNRSRTYSVRIVYALIMYGICGYTYFETVNQKISSSGYGLIGTGSTLFESIYALQLLGICLFVPAICCNVITSEKESGNFPLLLVTRLKPGTIILEKLFSRVIHFGTILLLALPLMAYAYVLGGVEMTTIWKSSFLLFLCMLQLASFAVMCSAFCRTNMAAFFMTYFLGVFIQFFIPTISMYLLYYIYPVAMGPGIGIEYFIYPLLSLFSGPIGCMVYFDGINIFGFGTGFYTILCFMMSCSTLFYLLMARRFLTTRAFVPSGSSTLRLFKRIDQFMKRINQNKLTRGIVLIGEKNKVPVDAPVAWRETTKTALGATHYLVRLLVAVEVPLILYLAFAFTLAISFRSVMSVVDSVYFLFWILAGIMIIAKSANIFTSEQANQTLDVLLATPIRTSDILQQKFKGIRRLFIVLAIPLFTLISIELSIISMELFGDTYFPELRIKGSHYSYFFFKLFHFLVRAASTIIFFHIIMYLTLWTSLQVKKPLRTIILTFLILGIWVIGIPLMIQAYQGYLNFDTGLYDTAYNYRGQLRRPPIFIDEQYLIGYALVDLLYVFSPGEMLSSSGPGAYMERFRYLYLFKGTVAICVYFGIMLLFRKLCYRKIMKELKRPEGEIAENETTDKENKLIQKSMEPATGIS